MGWINCRELREREKLTLKEFAEKYAGRRIVHDCTHNWCDTKSADSFLMGYDINRGGNHLSTCSKQYPNKAAPEWTVQTFADMAARGCGFQGWDEEARYKILVDEPDDAEQRFRDAYQKLAEAALAKQRADAEYRDAYLLMEQKKQAQQEASRAYDAAHLAAVHTKL